MTNSNVLIIAHVISSAAQKRLRAASVAYQTCSTLTGCGIANNG